MNMNSKKTIKFIVPTILFILFSFSLISINFNKLKLEIQELFGREVKAATETIGLVRQDCTGYSNCYTSLSAWEAAYGGITFGACAAGDLVCADKIAIAQIDGAWTSADTTEVIINGWTTDATHYIRVYTTSAARHQGKWDTGKYRLEVNTYQGVVRIKEQHVRVDGLQIAVGGDQTPKGINVTTGAGGAGSDARISNNIIKNTSASIDYFPAAGIFSEIDSQAIKAWNNIVYDFSIGTDSNGIFLSDYLEAIYVFNNTVYNNYYGIRSLFANGTTVKNNIANGNTIDYSGTFKAASSNNISQDATSPNVSLRSKTVPFVDSTNKDFHLEFRDGTGNPARDVGTDLSADANLAFSDDIDGNTRPVGSAWDIGADEESTIAPPIDSTPPVLSSGSPTGALPSGTTQTTLSLTTDENATCKYGTTPNTAYASIVNTFTPIGGTSHSGNLTGLTNGTSYNYYVRCQDTAGNANTTDYTISFSVSAPAGDTIPPTVSITSPTNGATVSGTITITANATDNAGIAGVQFKLDNSNLGTEDTTSPYSYSFNTTATTDGSHTLLAVARDTSNNYATSSIITVIVNNASPPPQITGITGTLIYGSTVTVTGTGFGTKTTAVPLKWDNFEIGVDGNDLTGYSLGNSGGVNPKYSSSTAHSGILSGYANFRSQYNCTAEYKSLNSLEEAYFSYWVKINKVSGANSRNIKLTRLTAGYSGGSYLQPSIGFTQFDTSNSGLYYYGTGSKLVDIWANPLTKGSWHRVEYYSLLSNPGLADGKIAIWVDGVQIIANNGIMTRDNTSNTFQWMSLPYYVAHDDSSGTPVALEYDIFYDDVYIDNTLARIELGNASTWSASTQKAIQIPSTWSNNSIVISFNQDSFVQGQTAYLYIVDENGNVNENGYQVTIGGTPSDTQAPTIPTGLTATPISSSQINLSWTASTDNVAVTGYKIYRCAGLACVPTTQIATSATNSYSNTGLTASTAYTYAISAFDAAGNNSAKSSSVSAATSAPPDTTPPLISAISFSTNENFAVITWTTNEPATSEVEYGIIDYGLKVTNSVLKTTHSITLNNLSSLTTYQYRIRVKDAVSNESVSITKTFQTTGTLPDTTPPGKTNDLSSKNITQTSVDLFWTTPGDDNGISGTIGIAYSYDMRYSTSSITNASSKQEKDTWWNNAAKATGLPSPSQSVKSEYVSVALQPNTTYYFALKTRDEVPNWSEMSNILSVKTQSLTPTPTPTPTPSPTPSPGGGGGLVTDTIPPSSPSSLKAISADKQIILSWKNPPDIDFTRVIIIRKEGEKPISREDGIIIYEGTNQEFTDINLDNDKTYYYAIYAYDRKPNYSTPTIIQAKPEAGKTSIPIERTVEQTLPYPNGSLLKSPDSDKIYVIVNNKKRWITNPEVFISYGFTPHSQTTVPKDILDQYQEEKEISKPSFKEGTLVRAKNDFKVYIIKPPYKRHIFNPAIFNMYKHFSWNDIKEIDQDTLTSYITSDLYRAVNDPKVFSLEEVDEAKGIAKKRWLNMTAQDFISMGYNWNQVFVINPEERDYYQEGEEIGRTD